jgi:hypothetical protein
MSTARLTAPVTEDQAAILAVIAKLDKSDHSKNAGLRDCGDRNMNAKPEVNYAAPNRIPR